jgi:hypothetical protein
VAVLTVPADPRTNGTRQLYFAQRWGKNAIFINTDCRSYRDIRMKTAANADDTGLAPTIQTAQCLVQRSLRG